MSTTSKPQADDQLDDEALKNLAGFFDALIEADLEQKRNAKRTGERPNGLTGKDNNQVPISIITGTKQNKGTKRGNK
jgi:hypothetical protein